MNIREIAQLAEVSVSTVSKIINGKDQNISQPTKERVLKIVKENNYVPYSDLRGASHQQSLLVGVMVNETAAHESLLKPVLNTAKRYGYNTIVCTSSDAKEEKRNFASLLAHHVDGIIWDRCEETAGGLTEEDLVNREIPFSVIDSYHAPALWNHYFDYKKLGYAAAQALIENRHQRIGCALRTDGILSKRFLSGYQQCLYDNKIPFDATLCLPCDKKEAVDDLILRHPSGIICYDIEIAEMIYQAAARTNLRIPQDLSLVGISDSKADTGLIPRLSVIHLPFEELGEFACSRVIEKIEKKKLLDVSFSANYLVNSNSSIDVPNGLRNKKIVVVGAINMDTLVNMGCYPKPGETILAKSRVMIPGGKGINQAIGAAKLGAEVHLIGKVGKDYDGSVLYDFLNANNVNVQAVVTDPKVSTGHAYIYVKDDGESGIVIYDGANQNLQPADVGRNEAVFENASFCLLQTEIQMETVEYAAKVAKKHGARVLLKPAAISKISDTLLANIDIFMPNRNEMRSLYPGHAPLEQKAQYFLDHGAKDVIVTLGHRGCYWRNAENSEYFAAADFDPVDTTGAADAFAATLAVYLSRNYDMRTAIRYATYAAGFSTTRQGVPPSLVDQSTLELYLSDI